MEQYYTIFTYSLATIFALGWGSFATMAVYRLTHGEPWIGRRPFCPKCNHTLRFVDYVSLLSYFLYRGKCRYCKESYNYHHIYFMTELLILIYFIVSFMLYDFSELFIINSGFIVAGVIWAMAYWAHQKSLGQMLIAMLFFATIKRVYLDHTIYYFIYGGILAFLLAAFCRFVYFALRGKTKQGRDFLEYKAEDRFANPSFIVVKLSIITGVMLGTEGLSINLILFLTAIMLFVRKLKYSLPILANIMIILMIVD